MPLLRIRSRIAANGGTSCTGRFLLAARLLLASCTSAKVRYAASLPARYLRASSVREIFSSNSLSETRIPSGSSSIAPMTALQARSDAPSSLASARAISLATSGTNGSLPSASQAWLRMATTEQNR